MPDLLFHGGVRKTHAARQAIQHSTATQFRNKTPKWYIALQPKLISRLDLDLDIILAQYQIARELAKHENSPRLAIVKPKQISAAWLVGYIDEPERKMLVKASKILEKPGTGSIPNADLAFLFEVIDHHLATKLLLPRRRIRQQQILRLNELRARLHAPMIQCVVIGVPPGFVLCDVSP